MFKAVKNFFGITDTALGWGERIYSFFFSKGTGVCMFGLTNYFTYDLAKVSQFFVDNKVLIWLAALMASCFILWFRQLVKNGLSSRKKIFPETYIEFALEKQKTNNNVQVVLVSKSNIQNFKFSNVEHLPIVAQNAIVDNVPHFIDVMIETIKPIEHYIVNVDALNTKLQPAAQTIFHGKHHAIIVRILGDLDVEGGKYKISANKSISYDKS